MSAGSFILPQTFGLVKVFLDTKADARVLHRRLPDLQFALWFLVSMGVSVVLVCLDSCRQDCLTTVIIRIPPNLSRVFLNLALTATGGGIGREDTATGSHHPIAKDWLFRNQAFAVFVLRLP